MNIAQVTLQSFRYKSRAVRDAHGHGHPGDEHSMSSYAWLCEQTSLPICGPETVEGKMLSRAEWIRAGACDMVRAGVGDVGGITPLIKTRWTRTVTCTSPARRALGST